MPSVDLLRLDPAAGDTIRQFHEVKLFTTTNVATDLDFAGSGDIIIQNIMVSANSNAPADGWFTIALQNVFIGQNYLAYKQPLTAGMSVIVVSATAPYYLANVSGDTITLQASTNDAYTFAAYGVELEQ
jgi:hypothetical protein